MQLVRGPLQVKALPSGLVDDPRLDEDWSYTLTILVRTLVPFELAGISSTYIRQGRLLCWEEQCLRHGASDDTEKDSSTRSGRFSWPFVEKVYSHGFSPPCSYHLSPCCSACPCTHCNDTMNPLNLAKKPSLGWSWADPAAATAEELTPLMQPMTFLHLLLFLFSSMLHLQGKSRCIYISTLINQHCTPHTQRCYIYVSFPKTAIYALSVVHNSVCLNHSLES